jgi:hypothetical protein
MGKTLAAPFLPALMSDLTPDQRGATSHVPESSDRLAGDHTINEIKIKERLNPQEKPRRNRSRWRLLFDPAELLTENRINAPANPFHFPFFAGTMNDIADLFFGEARFPSQRLHGDAFFKSFHDGQHLIGGGEGFSLGSGLFFRYAVPPFFSGSRFWMVFQMPWPYSQFFWQEGLAVWQWFSDRWLPFS